MSVCGTCLALEHASDDSLRALVVYQALQLDRLTGGRYEAPTGDELEEMFGPDDEDEDDEPERDPLPTVLSLLGDESIFRKPPRAAAPRLLELLRRAGWTLTYEEPFL